MANSVDPDQTSPIGANCSGSTLFASILNLSVMLGNYLQQTISEDDIFRCIFFLGALRGNHDIRVLGDGDETVLLSTHNTTVFLRRNDNKRLNKQGHGCKKDIGDPYALLHNILLPRSLSNDPQFIQFIYHYSHASKCFVEV